MSILAGAVAAAALCGIASGRDPGAPVAATQDVRDTYFGVTVADPYRWLEDAEDSRVKEWSRAQDARARQYLDALPQREPILRQLMAQISATSSSYYGLQVNGDRVFAFFNQPPKQQPMIALLGNDADPTKARIVVDPNAINPAGTTAVDWFVPSPDGRLLAVSLSENGSEDGTLHVFDVATGKDTGEVITRVQYPTGGGGLVWRADGKGFWYTRYPGPDRPADEQHFYERLYFHRLGEAPDRDPLVLGKDLPRVAEIYLDNHNDPARVLVTVANGDGGQYAHYVIDPDGSVRQFTRFEDKVVAVALGADGFLYLVSHDGAPRGKLLKLSVQDPVLAHARQIVAQSEAVMEPGGEFGGVPVSVTRDALYVRELVGGPSRVAIYDHEGRPRGVLPIPEVSTVDELQPLSDGTVLFSVATYLRPPYFARFDPATGKVAETALAQTSPAHFDDTEVVRTLAKSADGTAVPLSIIRRRDTKLDGGNPVLLTGYGGFAISLTPEFLGPQARLWLDAGGVLAISNLRGGGEFGEQWHQDGSVTHKQNVFDDFTACARTLIEAKYTTPARLAILGGSNGGLLMGAVFTQHPELFRAVVSQVGIYDMLRVERDPNGAFNVTEYGSVKDPAQFKALHGYSPYHHVVDGTRYPAIFMATGETDGRVNPAHSRKMIARLQAATASGYPVLLSINSHAGHGIGSALEIRVNQEADLNAFLFDQLGMRLPAPAAPPAH